MFDFLRCAHELVEFNNARQVTPFTVYQDNISTIMIAYMGALLHLMMQNEDSLTSAISGTRSTWKPISLSWRYTLHLPTTVLMMTYSRASAPPNGAEFHRFTELLMDTL